MSLFFIPDFCDELKTVFTPENSTFSPLFAANQLAGWAGTYLEDVSAAISTNGIFGARLLESEPNTSRGAPCMMRLMCPADDADDKLLRRPVRRGGPGPPLEERSHVLGLWPLGWCPASETHCDTGPDADAPWQRHTAEASPLQPPPGNSVIFPKLLCVWQGRKIVFNLVLSCSICLLQPVAVHQRRGKEKTKRQHDGS